jgi:hypothetical protein
MLFRIRKQSYQCPYGDIAGSILSALPRRAGAVTLKGSNSSWQLARSSKKFTGEDDWSAQVSLLPS